jgi:16S rRNA (guanine1516-N2)-methyltransferase
MFDHDASKTALVKKELQMIQAIAAPPTVFEQSALLAAARTQAIYKVVVKRAKLAEYLGGLKADYQVLGSHSRFDVYIGRGIAAAR